MWLRFGLVLWLCACGLWVVGGCEPVKVSEPVQESSVADGGVAEVPGELVPEPALPDVAAPEQSKPEERPGPEPRPELRAEPRAEPLAEPHAEPLADAGIAEEPGGNEPTPEPRPEVVPENQVPRPGFGAIRGDCGVLDNTEWNASSSFLFRNAIDFGTMAFDETKLTKGGLKIWKDGNLGGSSVHSEIFAHELLERCELSKLLKSEAEIKYKQTSGKKTDLLVEIDGRKVGVSVTRAFHFPAGQPYTESEATTLLTKKLSDIPLSAANADSVDAWSRSMLFILAYNKQHADMVETVYKKLDAKVKGDVILVVSVTDGKDDHIY